MRVPHTLLTHNTQVSDVTPVPSQSPSSLTCLLPLQLLMMSTIMTGAEGIHYYEDCLTCMYPVVNEWVLLSMACVLRRLSDWKDMRENEWIEWWWQDSRRERRRGLCCWLDYISRVGGDHDDDEKRTVWWWWCLSWGKRMEIFAGNQSSFSLQNDTWWWRWLFSRNSGSRIAASALVKKTELLISIVIFMRSNSSLHSIFLMSRMMALFSSRIIFQALWSRAERAWTSCKNSCETQHEHRSALFSQIPSRKLNKSRLFMIITAFFIVFPSCGLNQNDIVVSLCEIYNIFVIISARLRIRVSNGLSFSTYKCYKDRGCLLVSSFVLMENDEENLWINCHTLLDSHSNVILFSRLKHTRMTNVAVS